MSITLHLISDVTHLLDRVQEGDPKAAEALLPLIYAELRRLGAYPVSLNDLVPAIVSAVPKDPTSGQIPFYQRQADGTFLLSSQGWSHQSESRTDQSGDPKADDYVWPFPRKP